MKRVKRLLFILLLVIPVCIYAAGSLNYKDSEEAAHEFIKKGTYRITNERYILPTPKEVSKFIDKDDYLITKDEKGRSYLFDGTEYWTKNSKDDGHYIVRYNGSVEVANDGEKYSIRDVESVNPDGDIRVIGRGTYNNPWAFTAMYEVTVKTDTRYGYIAVGNSELARKSEYVTKNFSVTFDINAKQGYTYITDDCNGVYKAGKLTIKNVTRNLTCNVVFGTGIYQLTLKDANPEIIFVKIRDNYYTNESAKRIVSKITPPVKAGYKFKGYILKHEDEDIVVVNEDGTLDRKATNYFVEKTELDPIFEIKDPENVTITGVSGEKVYNKESVTLTCGTGTDYDSSTALYYQFGYSNSENDFQNGNIDWMGEYSRTGTYTISKNGYIGTKYYGCKIKARSDAEWTNEVFSSSTIGVTFVHPRIDFDANGGTLSGTATLYAGYGSNKVYTGRNNLIESSIPTASKTGYSFNGWYTDPTDGNEVITANKSLTKNVSKWTTENNQWAVTKLTNSHGVNMLYAHYKAVPLTFSDTSLNDGTYGTAYTSNAFPSASSGTGSYTYSLKSGYPTGAKIDSKNRTISFTNTTPAGTYNVIVHAKDNESGSEKDATMTIVINKILAILTCDNLTYSGSAQTACSCSGGKVGGTYSATATGTYTASCTGDENHTNPASKTWIMNKKALTITAKKQTINYGDTISTKVDQVTVGTMIDGHTLSSITLGASTTEATDAGTIIPSKAVIKNSGGTDVTKNYNINYINGTLVIKKVAATLTCSNKTYNGSAQTGCICDGGKIGGTYSATNAGLYTASCTGDSNHTSPSNKTWKINNKEITITAKKQTIDYGNAISSKTDQVTVETLVGSDKLSSITLSASDTNVTTNGTITPSSAIIKNSSGTDVTKNYSITYKNGKLVINKVAATLKCSNKTYNGSSQTACTCTGGTIGGTPSATAAGSYTASCEGDPNHTNPDDKKWTMNKKTITITAKNQTIDYGKTISNKVEQVTVETLVSSHTLSSITLSASTTEATTAGTITPSKAVIKNSGGTDVTKNYSITYEKGKLIINKARMVFTCLDKDYDGTEQTGCTCIGGTINGINKATDVGVYSVGCTPDSNHSGNASGSWRIKPMSTSITAKRQKIVYGTNIETGPNQVTVSKLASGHKLQNIGLRADTTNNVIIPSAAIISDANGKNVTANYNITYINGPLEVDRIPVKITCNNKTYNGQEQVGCKCEGGTITGQFSAINAGAYKATCRPDSTHVQADGVVWQILPIPTTITCNDSVYTGGYQNIAKCNGAINNQNQRDAGSYTIYCGAQNSNYSNTTKICTIAKSPATLTCKNKAYTGSTVYGCDAVGCSSVSGGSGTKVGTYTASCTPDSNHTAPAKQTWKIETMSVKVTFYRNQNSSDKDNVSQTFYSGNSKNRFGYKADGTTQWDQTGEFGEWTNDNRPLLGWSTSRTATEKIYDPYNIVVDWWIEQNSPEVTLYGVWENAKRMYLCRNDVIGWCDCVNACDVRDTYKVCNKARTSLWSSSTATTRSGFASGKNNMVKVYLTPSNNRYKVKSVGNGWAFDINSYNAIDPDGYWIDEGCIKPTTTDYDCLYTTCMND